MIPTLKKRLYDRLKGSRIDRDTAVVLVCVILSISVLAVPAVAQDTSFTDTFEDGNADGWTGNDQYPTVEQESVEGTYSAYSQTFPVGGSGQITWGSGPVLDLQQEFEVSSTFKQNNIDGSTNPVRIGVSSDSPGTEGQNAFVIFRESSGITYLGTYNGEPAPIDSNNTINDAFNNEWVNIEIYSPGDGTLEVKVWEYGTTEPTNPQLTDSFNATSGNFGFNVGNEEGGDVTREAWLDSVTLEGSTVTDTTLRLDTGNYLGFGETQDYTVYDLQGEREIRNDVTDNSTVTSGNTSVITVDENTNELTATTDENVSTRVNITATYNGRTDIRQVTVASPTIDNLDVLPFMWRMSAMVLDRGFQMILVSLLLSVAATRTAGVFAGLGIYQMGLTAGWLIGWVPIGLALVGLFTTLFIGLNIAANIDYSVRR